MILVDLQSEKLGAPQAAETAEVQGMVARVVGRVDAALVDLRAVMALARSSQGAPRGGAAHRDMNGRWQR